MNKSIVVCMYVIALNTAVSTKKDSEMVESHKTKGDTVNPNRSSRFRGLGVVDSPKFIPDCL
jgi:hypothetical protein